MEGYDGTRTGRGSRSFAGSGVSGQPLRPASRQVAHVGAGAWSRCFGVHRGEQELVVRFGQHVDDFRKDRLAAAFRTPELPIPTVLAIGEAFDGFYAVSTRVRGIPLESVSAAQWRSLVPALADALEAMRLADVSATVGFGGWDGAGRAATADWHRAPAPAGRTILHAVIRIVPVAARSPADGEARRGHRCHKQARKGERSRQRGRGGQRWQRHRCA